ncbi:MAG: dTDP-4-dehydrorhamnose reductase [Acutalibacteraceae bacterium]|nr:dTDP-4-dehydrorhamnose reductase [Acutalibacteraceae bacterium]
MLIVSGAKGQLGSDVCSILKKKGEPFIGIDVDTLDITDEKAVVDFFSENKVSCFIHCAAYTAVDRAESEEELCMAVNFKSTENIAKQCGERNAKMLYVSTDYVFGGNGTEPFDTDSPKNPLSVYGKSKYLGEKAVEEYCKKHFIVRTSWVFGENNTNFIATMLRLSESRDEINVVCDQIGSPTYSKDLAKLVCDIAQSEKYGTYHGTNEGFCSWSDLAEKAFEIAGKSTKVNPIKTEEYPTAAKRPLNSRLSKKSLDESGFERLPEWENAVKRYINNI